MLSSYRRVLATPGGWQFSLAGFAGRLPVSMVSLGIVLLVSAHTGSYGLAGTVASAYLLANAVFAVIHGRLADRFGQHLALPAAQLLFTVSLSLMIWAVQVEASHWLVHLLAAVSGAALPQVGACVRARWAHVLPDKRSVQTAFALEAVVDEGVFVTGPTLATFLATAWHPVAGLVTAITCGLIGTLVLALQRGTQPPARRQRPVETHRARMPWATVIPLAILCLALGTIFGAAEVITVAFAEEQGAKQWAGPLLTAWALGSLTAGVASGVVPWRTPPATRAMWGTVALALTMAPLPFVDSMWVMAGLLLLSGMAIAPTLIATMSATEEAVPASRVTEGMSILQTGMGIGIAPGAAIAGLVIDAHGASPAYLVPLAAGLLGAAAAASSRRPVTSST
ncbi:MFS transporter [Nocardioides sp. JQ2195]|uniref:MFS transporter n=1 Tax=Nocardioides sp. JQ2195 TaxID=2592334 RepID=UPI00143EC729|nr:MFS transporter [Nocardioides sp. JQ2195]QIX26455.1 MFS transporter [Nocardioides sp. JQ2195]